MKEEQEENKENREHKITVIPFRQCDKNILSFAHAKGRC